MTDVVACGTLACAYDWLQDFQALAAALVAILAALLVYRGARAQSDATVDAAKDLHEAERRSAAGALWSELGYCHAKLTGDAKKLQGDFLKGGNTVLRFFRTPVFDSAP